MINHYFTLHQVCRSLHQLIGCKLIECFTQDKDEIVLQFTDGQELYHLCVNLTPNNYCLNIRDKFSRARSNTKDIFPHIVGEVLQDVVLAENNRIITLKFIQSYAVIELYGATKSNFIVLSSKMKVLDYHRLNDEANSKGEKFQYPASNMKSPNPAEFTKIGDLLSKSDILLPKSYSEELLKQYELKYSSPISEAKDIDDILADAYMMRNDALHSSKYYLYTDESGGALLSLVPLSSFDKVLIFDDIHLAISRRYGFEKRITELETHKNSVLKKLKAIKKKVDSSVKMCETSDKLAPMIEDYTNWAEILLSHPKPKDKYGDKLESSDWYGNQITIPLDPKFNLLENSANYYKKAKKIKLNIEKKIELLPKYKEKQEQINSLISECETLDSVKEIKQFISNRISGDKKVMKEFDQRQESKFREFDLGDGYYLYVGKNASNNDELTVKFAKPNDIWMHARGSAGSHTVLKSPNPKEAKPPKPILKLAAQITAYYSKQKNAKYVPVAYTQKKNVHKPRGANPGAVVMSREEVIMVEPMLPAGEEE